MKKIYDYSDYRQFLSDYFETKKVLDSNFSYRYLGSKAGINSPTYFKWVMEGKRNLTTDTILKTCIAFDLDGLEAEYFENLVLFNQSKTVKKKNRYFEELIKLQKRKNVYSIPESQFEYFKHWYHCVIRELVTYDDFDGDYKKLAKRLSPPILPYQAKNSVKFLLKLGFLTLKNGKYLQSEPVITTGFGVNQHQIINFQIAMLKKAIQAFDNISSEERLTSMSTLSLSQKSFNKLVKKIREFQVDLLKESGEEHNQERVYQLNLNLFPLSNSESLEASDD